MKITLDTYLMENKLINNYIFIRNSSIDDFKTYKVK